MGFPGRRLKELILHLRRPVAGGGQQVDLGAGAPSQWPKPGPGEQQRTEESAGKQRILGGLTEQRERAGKQSR